MMDLQNVLKTFMLASGALAAVLGGLAGLSRLQSFSSLPARVEVLEQEAVQSKIMRTQINWLTREASKQWKTTPPDLSEFEQSRRDHARRN